jgi:hypothetical protein
LLADGRRIAWREQGRRFACSVGGTVVAGELRRVWVATAPGQPDRALVGVEGERRRGAQQAEGIRLAALRALGWSQDDGDAGRPRSAILLGARGPATLLLSIRRDRGAS